MEMDALLKYNGFKVEQKFGDFKKTPFSSESMKQIYVRGAGAEKDGRSFFELKGGGGGGGLRFCFGRIPLRGFRVRGSQGDADN